MTNEPLGLVNSDLGSFPTLKAVRVRWDSIQAIADSRDELSSVHSGGIPSERTFGCIVSCLSLVQQLQGYVLVVASDEVFHNPPV